MNVLHYGLRFDFTQVIGERIVATFQVPTTNKLFLTRMECMCFDTTAGNGNLRQAMVRLTRPTPPASPIGNVLQITPGAGVTVINNNGSPLSVINAPWVGCFEMPTGQPIVLSAWIAGAPVLQDQSLFVGLTFDAE
jgi:hypothetical protein